MEVSVCMRWFKSECLSWVLIIFFQVKVSRTPLLRDESKHWRVKLTHYCSSTLLTHPLVDKKSLKLTMKRRCKWLQRRWTPAGAQTVVTTDMLLTLHLCSRPFFDRRMGQEIEGDVMGDEFKGYIFRITGGNDKQGFQMKQGIMTANRARLLFKKRKFIFPSP